MTQTANPLKSFFRQPAIYIRLPSDGQFWPDGAVDVPVNRELPVLPMTAMDEITYRTPDALFNGAAIVTVIQSCMPNIKNAWHTPNCDLNAILTAIRIASYGKAMPLSTDCPACNETTDVEVDLQAVLAKLGMSDYAEFILPQWITRIKLTLTCCNLSNSAFSISCPMPKCLTKKNPNA